jgi:hypothetical protein
MEPFLGLLSIPTPTSSLILRHPSRETSATQKTTPQLSATLPLLKSWLQGTRNVQVGVLQED